ncbi:MAG: hypothetical protein AAGI71_18565 [Bacteroidota bacterium]
MLEVQVTVMGLIEQDLKTFLVPPDELAEIHFRTGWWRDKLVLTPRSYAWLTRIPGAGQEALTLKIKRKHRDRVHALLDRIEALPEATTPHG